jgi:hypothetical protein
MTAASNVQLWQKSSTLVQQGLKVKAAAATAAGSAELCCSPAAGVQLHCSWLCAPLHALTVAAPLLLVLLLTGAS